jgi:hypothetical protein
LNGNALIFPFCIQFINTPGLFILYRDRSGKTPTHHLSLLISQHHFPDFCILEERTCDKQRIGHWVGPKGHTHTEDRALGGPEGTPGTQRIGHWVDPKGHTHTEDRALGGPKK